MPTDEPVYRCEWGSGYTNDSNDKPIIEDHDLEWFTTKRRYDEGDRRRIAKLKVDQFLNLSSYVRTDDQKSIEVRHIVTRIK